MAWRDDNSVDTVILYAGIALAILGMAMAGVAVIKAMLLK